MSITHMFVYICNVKQKLRLCAKIKFFYNSISLFLKLCHGAEMCLESYYFSKSDLLYDAEWIFEIFQQLYCLYSN